MRFAHLLAAVSLSFLLGCGGSTEEGNPSGGGSGGTSGSGGSGNAGGVSGGGGAGGSGNAGGLGGAGGCATTSCGPDGAPCCEPNLGCANAGPGGGVTCTCTSTLVWSCTSGSGGSGGTGGGGTGGTGGGSPCTGTVGCAAGLTCCSGKCVNTANDPFNCGGCNNVCAASPQYCSGICGKPPCFGSGGTPPPNTFCCGQTFCKVGQLCCDVNGPGPSAGPTCHTPTQAEPTCPVGCPLCQ